MAVDKTMWTERARTLAFGLAVMAALLFGLLLVARPAHAATFTVNSTGDENDLDFPGGISNGSSDGRCDVDANTSGDQCTLRAAIQAASKRRGADTIAFLIPSNAANCNATSQVCNIIPASDLPTVTSRVTIDGYTQPGATENTLTQPDKTDAAIKIQLFGGHAQLSLDPGASNSVIRGLAIMLCQHNPCDNGILLSGGTGYRIEGNFIGVGADGTTKFGNVRGVLLNGASSSTIGGTDASDGTVDGVVEARNLISGNSGDGVHLKGGASGNRIEGNLIGTDRDGTSTPTNPMGNGETGVKLENSTGNGNRILSNTIFSNGWVGINLSGGTEDGNGVTVNDGDDPNTAKPDPDADTGPNGLQNNPLITGAQILHDPLLGDTTNIGAHLESVPSRKVRRHGRTKIIRETYTIQFFSSPEPDFPTGYGEGRKFLGEKVVTTDLQGKVTFTYGTKGVSQGEYITATATRNRTGDTSEFSEAEPVQGIVIGP